MSVFRGLPLSEQRRQEVGLDINDKPLCPGPVYICRQVSPVSSAEICLQIALPSTVRDGVLAQQQSKSDADPTLLDAWHQLSGNRPPLRTFPMHAGLRQASAAMAALLVAACTVS